MLVSVAMKVAGKRACPPIRQDGSIESNTGRTVPGYATDRKVVNDDPTTLDIVQTRTEAEPDRTNLGGISGIGQNLTDGVDDSLYRPAINSYLVTLRIQGEN